MTSRREHLARQRNVIKNFKILRIRNAYVASRYDARISDTSLRQAHILFQTPAGDIFVDRSLGQSLLSF